ncbi:transposase [Aromatoleum buckelii]|uniref:transposase n=1 Tax=Aromatoleum buckelii TaxID=200254 RepID=UPI003CCFF448
MPAATQHTHRQDACARVEHVFGAIEQMGGKLLRTIGEKRANFAMTMMAACYNLKRLVYFRKAGIKAF